MVKHKLSLGISYIYLFGVLFFALFPIFWMVMTSLKPQVLAFSLPPVWFFKPTLMHYKAVFADQSYGLYVTNSLIIAGTSTIVGIFLGAFGGYALDRGQFRHKKDLAFWIISTRMAPAISVVLPLYVIMSRVGLLGTRLSLIILYLTFNIPLAVWMMRSFFTGIPIDLEESARVDGCTKLESYFRILLPLVAPGLVATAIICFINPDARFKTFAFQAKSFSKLTVKR